MTEDNKKIIDWEEISLRELFEDIPVDMHQDEPDFNKGVFESMLEKYIEKNGVLRILHSNFNLSYKLLRRLSAVDGVEAIVPIGRYKVIVMFGKLFNSDDVKKSIKTEINKTLCIKDLRKNLKE